MNEVDDALRMRISSLVTRTAGSVTAALRIRKATSPGSLVTRTAGSVTAALRIRKATSPGSLVTRTAGSVTAALRIRKATAPGNLVMRTAGSVTAASRIHNAFINPAFAKTKTDSCGAAAVDGAAQTAAWCAAFHCGQQRARRWIL
ncbi:hypothetical protein SAMN05421747_109144 [Parapedobacter composti]|uniref:Uncharacterized protein n=1 Tax=Parapedobacter composti TaxID=623281 RepID=A0A1I1ILY2_9SPHI|nr:hypothetical protein SAMN05421747_109144 [Parapedobacter composti]